jgi:type IX secretion system PorP/SprF family membrane protein
MNQPITPMSIRLFFVGIALNLFCTLSFAQGLHFTQYNMSPLTLNPALSGKYEGTFRVGGIARDQWRSVIASSAYQTQSAYIDSPILKGLKRGDWVGLGVMAFQDVVSAGKLKHSAFKISAAYHLALDAKRNNVLSIGGQFGSENRNVTNNYRYEADILTNKLDSYGSDGLLGAPANGAAADAKANASNWNAGVMLSSKLNKTTDAQLGLTIANLTRPTFDLGGSKPPTPGSGAAIKDKIARRVVFHGKFDAKVSKLWTVSPSFLFQTTQKQDVIMIQALAGYLWDAKRDLTFNMGLSYRLADAISPMLGARYKKLTVGFAYDIRTGQILNQASGGRGGMEIAAYYIQRIYKQPKVKEKILCPRF